jgi:putative effector of murein hydrolase
VKVLGVVVGGFFYSLCLVTFATLGVRKMLGTTSVEASASGSGPAKKPYDENTTKFLVGGAIVSAALSVAATKTGSDFQKPLETLFFGFTTLASYVWGANLPSSITKIFNPLLTSALVTLGVARVTSEVTGTAFKEILRSYTCKKLSPMEAGAGDLLLFLLSPSVISFAIGMYKGKNLIANNLPAIVTAVTTGSVGSMFGTAALARLINLGGSEGQVIRLAAVPRSTQTALGMTIAGMLGGDVAIAATVIILTGIFGGMVGVKTLNAWGVKDSVSRGLGIGSAGLSLGVVSIKNEPEAFAFAGLCLVLTAVAATCLASIPAVSDLLINIAGGAPKIVEAVISTGYQIPDGAV